MTAIPNVTTQKEFQRFSRFLTVGAVGTLLDFSLLTLLKLSGLSTLFANSFSFTAGLINNFTWNRLWTFHETVHLNWHRQLVQFTVISLIGLALNNVIVLSLEQPLGAILGQPDWGYLPAKAIATSAVVFWNYFANRKWTFKCHCEGDSPKQSSV